MRWILKLIPICTVGFCLYVIWVVIKRERLDIVTAHFAATDIMYADPYWSLNHKRDIISINNNFYELHKVVYIPCIYRKRRVSLVTQGLDYYGRSYKYLVLK